MESAVENSKREFLPKSVLVTGGCGFIGSNFVNYVAKKWPDALIVNFDKLVIGSDACNVALELRKSDRYLPVIGDLCNRKLLDRVFNKYKIDTVVNFAANSNVDECYADPVHTVQNNVIGTTVLLEACRHYGNLELFLHVSSDEVYGDSGPNPGAVPKSEDSPLTPTNQYAASKAACETLLNSYAVSYRLPSITIRMNNVYGPRQWESKVIPKFIKEAKLGQPFTIMGDGSQKRSWMFTDDACEGIRLLVEKGRIGQIYNLGTHFELSIIDLAKAIHKAVAEVSKGPVIPFQTVPMEDRPYNDKRYFINFDKMHEELGWQCEMPFEEGLRRTVAWFSSPREGSQTEHVMVFGGNGWIGEQFVKYLEHLGTSFTRAKSRPGSQPDQAVETEILDTCPTHIISFIGRTKGPGVNSIEYLDGGSERLHENLESNLYAPWVLAALGRKLGIHMTYIGTGCLFEYNDDHPIAGKGYTEEDVPNYLGNSYSVVKGFTDRIMKDFSNVLNVRIRLPVNFEAEPRNLVKKVTSFKNIFDIADSLTVLPDSIPIIFDLMQRHHTGTINMTNPGPIRHSETLELYKKLVDPEKTWTAIDNDSSDAKKMRQTRAHCALDTSVLEGMYPHLRTAKEGIYQAVVEVGRKMGTLNEEQLDKPDREKIAGFDHAWA